MIVRTLDTAYWPPPAPCPVCGHSSAFRVGGALWCTSIDCDPHAVAYLALDRHFTAHPCPIYHRSHEEDASGRHGR